MLEYGATMGAIGRDESAADMSVHSDSADQDSLTDQFSDHFLILLDECLSVRAKAAMMDRFAQLVRQQGGAGPSWIGTMPGTPLPLTIHLCAR